MTRCAQKVTLNDIVNQSCSPGDGWQDTQCAAWRSGPRRSPPAPWARSSRPAPRLAVARYPNSLPAVLDRQDGQETSRASRLHRFSLPVAPESRGSLRIKSADPSRAAGNPHQLSRDRNRSKGLHRRHPHPAQHPRSTRAEGLRGRGGRSRSGKCRATTSCSLDLCRRTGSTVYHPTSTCRMGSDALAVVDQRACACAALKACGWSMHLLCRI